MSNSPKTTVHQNKWYKITRREENINGKMCEMYVLERDNAVGIIPIDKEGNITFISQKRYTTQEFAYEFPAGIIDPGETPEIAANRELQEEAGIISAELISIGTIFVAPGTSNQKAQIFLAKSITFVKPNHESTENIEEKIYTFSLPKVQELIMNGKISGSFTLALLAKYFAYLGTKN